MLTFGARPSDSSAVASREVESAAERVLLYGAEAWRETGGWAPALAALGLALSLLALALAQGRGKKSGGLFPAVSADSTSTGAKKKKKQQKQQKQQKQPGPPAGPTPDISGTRKQEIGGALTAHEGFAAAAVGALAFYLVVWNGVFSNLPLRSRDSMAWAVHVSESNALALSLSLALT